MNKIKNHTTTSAGVANFEEVTGLNDLGVFAFSIQARTGVDIQYAYEASPTEFITVKSNTTRSVSWDHRQGSFRLFIKCATAGTIVELELSTGP